MKKSISPLHVTARRLIFWSSLLLFSLAVLAVSIIFKSELKAISVQNSDLGLTIGIALFFLPFVASMILTFNFIKKGYDMNVYLVLKKYESGRKEKQYNKFLEAKKQVEETGKQISELYGILCIFGTEKPLVLGIETRTAIVDGIAPAVYVNDKPVVTKTVDERIVHCLIERAVNADSDMIRIKLGQDIMEFKNPYYINKTCTDLIPWQCEGHSEERAIYLPKTYMPHAVESYAYPFNLYVNDRYAGEFTGTYDADIEIIMIPLGKEVSKADCQNKSCYIRVPFGRRDKINLPKPTVILRNGERVPK